MKVAICDDEVPFLLELDEALKLAGHEVHTATRLEALINVVRSGRFDALAVDLRMPGSKLEDLGRALQSLGDALPPKIVLMTGHADDGTLSRIEHDGWVVLTKPFAMSELLKLLCPVQTAAN